MQNISDGIQQLATMTSYNSKGAPIPTTPSTRSGCCSHFRASGQQVSQIGPNKSVN